MSSRAFTQEEVREQFLSHIRHLAHYWSRQQGTPLDLCEGMAHSILSTIDGVAGGFPCSLDLVCRPHPDDKQFHIDEGDNYVEDGQVINDCLLHEMLHRPNAPTQQPEEP